eukprot:15466596-Alexandrium_andersonii.AAC.1
MQTSRAQSTAKDPPEVGPNGERKTDFILNILLELLHDHEEANVPEQGGQASVHDIAPNACLGEELFHTMLHLEEPTQMVCAVAPRQCELHKVLDSHEASSDHLPGSATGPQPPGI